MKVTVPVAALFLAVAFGYTLGTESGRKKRDDLLVRLGRGTGAENELGVDDAGL